MIFEKATEKDLPRIVEIYNESIPGQMATADLKPVSVKEREPWFKQFNDHYPIWVIKDNQNIMGWVSIEAFYGRPAYHRTVEVSIYIANEAQHQGLGQRALDYVFANLNKLGHNTIVAFIFSHNIPSQKLFKKNGFEVWGHLPDVADMDGKNRSLDILGRKFN